MFRKRLFAWIIFAKVIDCARIGRLRSSSSSWPFLRRASWSGMGFGFGFALVVGLLAVATFRRGAAALLVRVLGISLSPCR
jgi:hypothetical protein